MVLRVPRIGSEDAKTGFVPMLPKPAAPLVGMFDFRDHEDLVETLSALLELEAREVRERLFQEALVTGWNVSRAAAECGLVPHVYDDSMEAFYARTNAFVFELAVIHQHPYCKEIDARVSAAIAERFPDPAGARVLVLGDGIGTDSLRLALAGCSVTYFEFEGYSSALARHRFARAGVLETVSMVHAVEEIPEGRFDVVVNREVLEHVKEPQSVIENIWRYLAPGGIAIVTESFGRVEPEFPTHLAENARYAGQTPRMFVDAGFRVVKVFPEARPMVFEKTDRSDLGRFGTLPRDRRTLLGRVLRRLASGTASRKG